MTTDDADTFLEAACQRADRRGYHAMTQGALSALASEALLDCIAVYAALGRDGRALFAAEIAERLRSCGALVRQSPA